MNPKLCLFLLVLTLCLSLHANTQDALSPQSSKPAVDTVTQKDSSRVDTVTAITADGQMRKIVKRDFNAKEQVVVGTIVMAFIVIIITTVGNWNP